MDQYYVFVFLDVKKENMSDERYKDGFQEHLKDFGFDPYRDHTWSSSRIKEEKKRMSMLTLIPVLFLVLIYTLQSEFVEMEYSTQAWNVTRICSAVMVVFFGIFIIRQFISFRPVNSPGSRFLAKWLPYLKDRIKQIPLLIIGICLGVFSLVNLTYDAQGGIAIKIGITILVSFAGYMLLRYLLIQPYLQSVREAEYRLKNMRKGADE